MGKTLVLGLGNDLLGDDAVGMMVVGELRRRLPQRDDLVFQEASVAGLALLDLVCGYENLIVIDSIKTQGGKPGQIYRLTEESLLGKNHRWSAHGLGFRTVMELGRRCACQVPENVVIYAIEAEDAHCWGGGCTPGVREAIPIVVRRIMKDELSTCVQPSVCQRGEDL